jgi:flagella basal body P-ring formation protein FlgA
MLRTLTIVLAAGLLFASDAATAQPGAPALKADATITGEFVRIADLVENAGSVGEIAIFRAPDLGLVGAVPTARVIEALRPHRLAEVDTRGITQISVVRASRSFGSKEIEARIVAALAEHSGLGPMASLALTFDRELRSIDVEPSAGELRVQRSHYDPSSGRFDVSLDVADSDVAKRMRLRFTGTAVSTVEVAVLTRPLARGDMVRTSDVARERRPKSTVAVGSLNRIEQIVGQAARRPIDAGQMMRASDLMKPELVRQNEPVTITYEVPGLLLSLRGKALESGTDGDVVNVLNIQSKRTVQAVVAGPGRVILLVTSAQAPNGEPVTGSIALTSPPRNE